ncbi:T9SS type A sorting domain-containing protein [Labilibacter sediminis]|nr:T9SS type A sorting domain-containing protein [Labilibacter sediminis]
MNYRINLKNLWLALVLLFSMQSLSAQNPNVIVIVVDDAGYADWGFQGSTVMETPRIDQLRSEGTNFTHAYVTNSVCAPSRAGLLTGRYQNRFGFEYNIVEYYAAPDHTLADVGLDPNEKTIANYLKDLGYSTSAIGKWHLGEETHHHPNNRGFDYFYGLLSGSRPYFHTADLPANKKLMRNFEVDDMADGYMTDVLTEDAINWMTQQVNADKPFFTYLSYTAVHGPYESKTEDFDYFTDNCIGFDGAPCSDKRQNYAAMTYSLDYNVGNLIDNLKTLGVYDNTLIFFINDNGGKSPQVVTDNGELRGGKSSQYEGGLRVPFFCVWPGHVPAGAVYDKQVISLDILPTIINAAGGTLPTDREFDGVDLVPFTNNTGLIAHDYLYWRKFLVWSVVQSDNKKLIINYNGPDDFDNDTLLYDLNLDIRETNNLYTSLDDEVAADLMLHFEDWEKDLKLPAWIANTVSNTQCSEGVTDMADCENIMIAYGKLTKPEEVWSMEAEDGELSGAAEVRTGCDNASGNAFVKLSTDASNSLLFNNINIESAGSYQLRIKHFNSAQVTLQLFVNNIFMDQVIFPEAKFCYQGPSSETIIEISLNAGVNSIELKPVQGLSSPLLDRVAIFTPVTTDIFSYYKNEQPNYSVYPNPCTNHLYIKGVKGFKEFTIYSINGSKEYQGLTDGSIDLSAIRNGLYVLEIASNYKLKFIKE